MPRRVRNIAIASILFLVVVPLLTFYLLSVLPASTATVTITPTSRHLASTQTIEAVTGTPDAERHQGRARLISYTTPTQSRTVTVTGKGHQNVTSAKGTLTFSNPGKDIINVSTEEIPYNGTGFVSDMPFDLQVGQSITVPAHAVHPGSNGNIPAHVLDGTYDIYTVPDHLFITTVYGQNSAFTGGQDAYDYTFVQQSDIDNAATPLESQLTSAAQTAVQQQVRTNERPAKAVACTPKVSSDNHVNDRVTNVAVTVSVTCQGEVYDPQSIQSMAGEILKSNAASQLGTDYALVGNLMIGVPQVQTVDNTGTITFKVPTEGIWVYQFSTAQKQQLAQFIAGKRQVDAVTLLLKQRGISKVGIQTSGSWGNALPTSPTAIKLIVLNVRGLQAVP